MHAPAATGPRGLDVLQTKGFDPGRIVEYVLDRLLSVIPFGGVGGKGGAARFR